MKLPSIKYLIGQAADSFARFYAPLLFAFAGTCIALMMVNDAPPENIRALLSCVLGLSLSVAFATYGERRGDERSRHLLALLSLVLAAAYWYWLAPSDLSREMDWKVITFFVLLVGVHLLVAIAPYIGIDERKGFWRYNETLFTRFLLSAVFSGTLFVGLALAILACDLLFQVDIDDRVYLRLWIIIAGIFNTWFFLAGVPRDYKELNGERTFPKALKVFVQFILLPLVALYTVILYVYGIKIVAQWQLPDGQVSMLIICYTVSGILAILLGEPLRHDTETPWMRLFTRWFFRAALPLVVLLYAAIAVRVGQYGITEPRYFLVLLGVWLGFISLYFIFSRQQNIKVIPLSLAVISFLSVFGPWSAFSVSARSQRHRLQQIMQRYHLHLASPAAAVAMKSDDAKQVEEIIEYYVERMAISELQPVFQPNLRKIEQDYMDSTGDRWRNWQNEERLRRQLVKMINVAPYTVEYVPPVSVQTTVPDGGIDVSGYGTVHEFSYSNNNHPDTWFSLNTTDSLSVMMYAQDTITELRFIKGGNTIEKVSVAGLMQKISAMSRDREMPVTEMTLTGTGALQPRIIVRSAEVALAGTVDNEKAKLMSMEMWILLK